MSKDGIDGRGGFGDARESGPDHRSGGGPGSRPDDGPGGGTHGAAHGSPHSGSGDGSDNSFDNGFGDGSDSGFGDGPAVGEPGADDALMAVLLGESPAEGDSGAAAAARDMRILGEQLRLIGDALAREEPPRRPGPSPEPDLRPDPRSPSRPDPRPRSQPGPGLRPVPQRGPRPKRRRRLAAALAASAAVLATLAGIGIGVQYQAARGGAADAESAKLTAEGYTACARLIAEGTVVRTESVPGRTRVVLKVESYLKPAAGPKEQEFLVPREETANVLVGTRLLVIVSRLPEEGVSYYTGAEIPSGRSWVTEGLAGDADLPCPGAG
ncbi:hypothetical protein ACFYT4_00085 [Streptomyces sp. NPDC004609]|uniref:hypothetical protein n=1 Tax=Streptomyces sp. NPDC004609 TaxID=3364704 RepID=UPI003693C579